MSRPKGGRSVQLRGRGTAFESERSRHFPYMDYMDEWTLKWGVSVVFIAKALCWAPRVRFVMCARIRRWRQ